MADIPKPCAQCGKEVESKADLCDQCLLDATLVQSTASTQNDIDSPTLPPSPTQSTVSDTDTDHGSSVSGTNFGDYELIEEIARGGMGIVFKARHRKLNRIAAVKMIRDGQFSSQEEVQRFHIEAEAAAQLDHSGIVPIYEISDHNGQPFFAMKFVEGGSLAAHRDRIRADRQKLVEFVVKIADAVHHAHQRGILHRDIKPANILLDEDDNPLITDLGLAKTTGVESGLTQTGAIVGTPSYMPPEQADSNASITTAADVYSIGAILYELLTEQPPHRGSTPVETLMRVINEPVTPVRDLDAQVDRDLELICMKCLEHAPASRYVSAAALSDDLQRWLRKEPISVRPPSITSVVSQWIRRNQGIGYAVLALIAGCLLSLPIILSLLGAASNPAALYSNTVDDPRPLVYSYTNIPTWVAVGSSLFMLVLWSMMGLLVCLVTKPTSWKAAAFNGLVTGGTCILLMGLCLGWVLFMLVSQLSNADSVQALSELVWLEEGADEQVLRQELDEMYPLLEGKAPAERADYIRKRVMADGLAQGPQTLFVLTSVGLLFGAPIFMGSIVAFVLISRKQRLWILVPRYVIAWMACFLSATILCAALINGNVNGRAFWDMPIIAKACYLIIPPLVIYVTLRKWRKPSVETSR